MVWFDFNSVFRVAHVCNFSKEQKNVMLDCLSFCLGVLFMKRTAKVTLSSSVDSNCMSHDVHDAGRYHCRIIDFFDVIFFCLQLCLG